MKAPFIKTGVALAVLGGLLAYAYWVEPKRKEAAEKAKAKEKVFAVDKGKVTELSLDSRDGEDLRVAKEGGAWRLTAPQSAPADSGEVESLLGSLQALEVEEVVAPSPGALADFGLEKPALTVSVLAEGAKAPARLLIGDKTPDGAAVYAKLPDQPRVFTIPGHMESSLNKKPFDLRDRDVLHVKRDHVQGLEVSGPQTAFTLARETGDEWSFTKPLRTRAGRWSVDGLVGNLESLRQESIAAEEAEDLKKFGLHQPTWTIALGLAGGTQKRLEIGAKAAEGDNKYYAREAGSRTVAVIPGALVDDLSKGLKEYRAQRLLDVATYEVTGFDVETEGAKRVFTRSASKDKEGIDVYHWKRTTPDGKDVDTNTVQDALFKLGAVEIKEFQDRPGAAAEYGLDAPAFKLTVRYGEGKPPVWVEVASKGTASYGRRAGDEAVLSLDPSKAEELVKAFKAL